MHALPGALLLPSELPRGSSLRLSRSGHFPKMWVGIRSSGRLASGGQIYIQNGSKLIADFITRRSFVLNRRVSIGVAGRRS